jgi:hypothetical protein
LGTDRMAAFIGRDRMALTASLRAKRFKLSMSSLLDNQNSRLVPVAQDIYA